MMILISKVYIKLLDEGLDVYRKVKAKRISNEIFIIGDQKIPESETWEFLPGEKVFVERRKLSGKNKLITVSKVL